MTYDTRRNPLFMTDTAPAVPASPTAGPEALSTQQPPRPKALSLRKNFSWTFAGNVVNAGSQWAMIAIMAKLGSAEMVGVYSWSLAVAMPVITFGMLQLRPLFVTDIEERHHFADYLGLRLLGMVAAVGLIAAYGLLTGSSAATLIVLILVASSRAIDSVSDLFRGLYQKYEQMHFAAGNWCWRGITSLLVIGFVLWMTGSLMLAMAGLCIGWLLITVFYDIRIAKRLHTASLMPTLHWHGVKEIIPTSIPLGLMMGLIILNSSIPRLFLEPYHGTAAVGYFSGAYYPLSAGALVIGALGQSALPRLARLWKENTAAYTVLMGKLVGIGLFLGIAMLSVAWSAGELLLRLAYTPDFAAYSTELVILAAGTIFTFVNSFIGYGLTAARQFRIQPLIALASCGAVTAASALLVPAHGVKGAAIAYMISAAVAACASVLSAAWALSKRTQANVGLM